MSVPLSLVKKSPAFRRGNGSSPEKGQQPQPQPPLLLPQPLLHPQPLPQNRNRRMMAMMIQQQLLPPKQEF